MTRYEFLTTRHQLKKAGSLEGEECNANAAGCTASVAAQDARGRLCKLLRLLFVPVVASRYLSVFLSFSVFPHECVWFRRTIV